MFDDSQTVQVTDGDKVGFCLLDSDPIPEVAGPPEPGVYMMGNFCAAGDPAATALQMGTSEGWRDVYSFILPLQWIDVTNVAPGNYYLAARPDPNNRIQETDESNNGYVFGEVFATVPGYVAQDLAFQILVAHSFDLEIEKFTRTIDEDPDDGNQVNIPYPKGVLELTLLSMPVNGTLTQGGGAVATGVPYASSTSTYTPDGGYLGPDSFTYSAADSDSFYPLNPVVATVTISVSDNVAPMIVNPGDQANEAGDAVGVGLSIQDADGDDVTLTATGLPPGVVVSGHVFTGSALIPGTYDVVATANDGAGGIDVEVFQWVISGDLVLPFADVSGTHLFAEDITWMYALGISFGCGDGSDFCPDEDVTREQVASFLSRAFELADGAGDDLFGDDDGSVHEDNIDRLAHAGVTNGCNEGLYCPGTDLSRAQFATLQIRALELLTGADFSAAAGLNYFTDDDGSVHEPNIDKLRFADITFGCTPDLYCPRATLSRGQLAALLHRALG